MAVAPLSIAAAAPPVQAVTFDVRCLIALQSAQESATDEVKQKLESATMFYFGRFDSELKGSELEARLSVESAAIEGQDTSSWLKQCGEFMQLRGQAWIDMGTRLKAAEKTR